MMEKPEWIFGNEKRFYDFISKLGDEKTLIISHTDLDGIGAAKVINEVVNANELMFVNYDEINPSLAEKLRLKKPKKIIISDLFFKENDRVIQEIEKFADILIIDHHKPDRDFNSSKTVHMNAQGFCATYLAYYLFLKVQNIEYLDWLVACASVADILYFENKKFMENTFSKYGDKLKVNDDRTINKSGAIWDAQWNITLTIVLKEPDYISVFNLIPKNISEVDELKKVISDVQKEYDELVNRFEKEKIKIKDGFVWELNPKYKLTSLLTSEISFKYQNKTCIFVSPVNAGYKFSSRRQDGKVDLNIFSSKLVEGFENSTAGGHVRASGGFFPKKYLEEFKKRLQNL